MFDRRPILAFIWLLMSSGALYAEIPTPTKSEVLVFSKAQLTAEQLRDFARFKRKQYNGAFFIAQATEHAQWGWNYNSLEVAKIDLKSKCEAAANKKCELYAVVIPKGQSISDVPPVSLSHSARTGIKNAQRNHKKTTYGAFAVAPSGSWGTAWNHNSKKSAQTAAIKNCQKNNRPWIKQLSNEAKSLIQSKGLLNCRIFENFR